jgi:hypothetical protein
MPSKSKSQYRLMNMALAYKRGKLDLSRLSDELKSKIKNISKNMSEESLKHFTKIKKFEDFSLYLSYGKIDRTT